MSTNTHLQVTPAAHRAKLNVVGFSYEILKRENRCFYLLQQRRGKQRKEMKRQLTLTRHKAKKNSSAVSAKNCNRNVKTATKGEQRGTQGCGSTEVQHAEKGDKPGRCPWHLAPQMSGSQDAAAWWFSPHLDQEMSNSESVLTAHQGGTG